MLATALFLTCGQANSQDGGKPLRNPQPQAELMERMRAAQQEIKQLSPEQIKMMEQMGIVLPDLNNMPGVSGSAASQVMAAGLGPVPAKDVARITGIAKYPLTDAGMAAYLDATHRHVSARIKADSRKLGDKVFDQMKSSGQSPASIGNAATGLWAMGRVQVAIYLMGKALAAEPTNTDNQSNYAAMLAMSGGEPLAIPLLDKLNRRFPGNSTILNNLGQAWFNLGDLDKADQFLKEAVRLYAYHPQANFTQSFIEESKGNHDQAVELVKKAVRHSLSLDKENRLRKLGYKLTGDDIRPFAKPDPDPMGLSNFKHPAFPRTAAEEIKSRGEWQAFNEEVQGKIMTLSARMRALKPMDKALQQAMAAQNFYMDGGAGLAKANATKAAQTSESTLPFARRARLKLMQAEKDAGAKFRLENSLDNLKTHHKKMAPLHKAYFDEWQALIRKEAAQTGEGQANKDFCAEFSAQADKYLGTWNAGHEQLFDAYLQQLRLKLTETLYWKQFTQNPEAFEYSQLDTQIRWLAALVSVPYGEIGGVRTVEQCFDDPSGQPTSGKLADFYDLNCPYHSELNLGFGSIKSDCNKMTSQLGIGFLSLGLKQDMDKNTFSDQFVSCNVEVTAGKGADVDLGPLTVGVSATLGMEIGRSGIQDVYLTGEVGAGVSTNAMGKMCEAGYPASMAGIGVGDKTVFGVSSGGRISLVSGRGSSDGVTASFLK